MTVPRCGCWEQGQTYAIVLTFLGPQPPVYFSSDSLSSHFLHILKPTMEREKRCNLHWRQQILHWKALWVNVIALIFCSYGYEPQPTLCFSAMLLLRIESMNDKGDVPRQQGKGQNEYKRVIILYKIFIIITVWDKGAGIIIIIVWDKVAGILPFFSPYLI